MYKTDIFLTCPLEQYILRRYKKGGLNLVLWIANSLVYHGVFVHFFFCTLLRPYKYFSRLYCFIFLNPGPYIADYAIWVLLIVDGRTVTYSCKLLCHFVSGGELAIIQHLLLFMILYLLTLLMKSLISATEQ